MDRGCNFSRSAKCDYSDTSTVRSKIGRPRVGSANPEKHDTSCLRSQYHLILHVQCSDMGYTVYVSHRLQ